jgi:hypothetical protein
MSLAATTANQARKRALAPNDAPAGGLSSAGTPHAGPRRGRSVHSPALRPGFRLQSASLHAQTVDLAQSMSMSPPVSSPGSSATERTAIWAVQKNSSCASARSFHDWSISRSSSRRARCARSQKNKVSEPCFRVTPMRRNDPIRLGSRIAAATRSSCACVHVVTKRRSGLGHLWRWGLGSGCRGFRPIVVTVRILGNRPRLLGLWDAGRLNG